MSNINYWTLSLNKCIMFVDNSRINMTPINEFSQSYILFIQVGKEMEIQFNSTIEMSALGSVQHQAKGK